MSERYWYEPEAAVWPRRTRGLARTALVLVFLVVSACSPAVLDEPAATTAPPATEATTTTTVPNTTTSTSTTTTTTVSASLTAADFRAPFTMERPDEAWRVTYRAADWLVEVSTPIGNLLIFTAVGASDIDAWIEKLTTDPGIVATEATPGEIGSHPAVILDISLTEDWDGSSVLCPGPCRVLFHHQPTPEHAYGWVLLDDFPNRVWLVDVNGTTVAIFAEATGERFESWVEEVGIALATLTWTR